MKYYGVFKITAPVWAGVSPAAAVKSKKLTVFKESFLQHHGHNAVCRCVGDVYDSRNCAMIKAELNSFRQDQEYKNFCWPDKNFATRYYIHECFEDGWLKASEAELKEAGIQ